LRGEAVVDAVGGDGKERLTGDRTGYLLSGTGAGFNCRNPWRGEEEPEDEKKRDTVRRGQLVFSNLSRRWGPGIY